MKNLRRGRGTDDSGISVSKLIPNPSLFLERPARCTRSTAVRLHKPSDLNYLARLRAIATSPKATNLDLGTSFVYGHNDAAPDLKTRLYRLDATIRYRPLRRAIYKRFKGRTEFFWSRRDGTTSKANAFGIYSAANTSSPGGGLPAPASIFRSRVRPSLTTRRSRSGDLLAERVQPDPQAVPPDALRRGRRRATSRCSSSCSRSARTGRTCFKRPRPERWRGWGPAQR